MVVLMPMGRGALKIASCHIFEPKQGCQQIEFIPWRSRNGGPLGHRRGTHLEGRALCLGGPQLLVHRDERRLGMSSGVAQPRHDLLAELLVQ